MFSTLHILRSNHILFLTLYLLKQCSLYLLYNKAPSQWQVPDIRMFKAHSTIFFKKYNLFWHGRHSYFKYVNLLIPARTILLTTLRQARNTLWFLILQSTFLLFLFLILIKIGHQDRLFLCFFICHSALVYKQLKLTIYWRDIFETWNNWKFH